MSGDVFSNSDGENKAYEPWYEKEHRTWLEFRKGCKGKVGPVCYVMDAKLICKEDGKGSCPLWFAAHFKSRPRRDNEPIRQPAGDRLA